MKVLLTILSFLILVACSNNDSTPIHERQQESVSNPQDSFMLNGLWAMPNYVDSILKYKTISKYRMQWPSLFAILIEIDNDTLRTYGSINDIETSLDTKNDTLHVFQKTIKGQLTLTLNNRTKKLELRNTDTTRKWIDKTDVYVFEKRPDLKFLTDTLDHVHYTSTSFTNFFHDQLLAGTYEIIGTEKKVIFSSNGQVQGFQDFHKYRIDNYFGTLHPYNNLDNITFNREIPENSNEFDWELFKWEFQSDTLVLTQFNWELNNYQGRKVRDEIWELSSEQIKMKRK